MKLSAGDVIKLARQRKGMTQSELGNLLGVGKSTIQKYENGYVTNLKLETIRGLCIHLDLLPTMLIFPGKIHNNIPDSNLCHHNKILKAFLALNYIAQIKTYEYMLDLSESEKYRR